MKHLVLIIWMLIFTSDTFQVAAEIPDHPPPDAAISWDVHRSLGVILMFQTDQGNVYFAHPVVMSHAVPECRGIKEEATGDLWQITETNNSHIPMRHIVTKEAIAWRYEGEDWQTISPQSFLDLPQPKGVN